jgi:hypothetical protein
MIITKEQELFDFLKSNHIPDLEPSEHPTSRHDCYSQMYEIDIELKCRTSHYDDLLIEKKKYDALIQRAVLFSTRPYYINSTPNGVWSFNLLELPTPMWEDRRMPKTTFFADNQNIMKSVGYINISQGMRLL